MQQQWINYSWTNSAWVDLPCQKPNEWLISTHHLIIMWVNMCVSFTYFRFHFYERVMENKMPPRGLFSKGIDINGGKTLYKWQEQDVQPEQKHGNTPEPCRLLYFCLGQIMHFYQLYNIFVSLSLLFCFLLPIFKNKSLQSGLSMCVTLYIIVYETIVKPHIWSRGSWSKVVSTHDILSPLWDEALIQRVDG